MSLFFGLRAYRKRTKQATMKDRTKILGLCVLTVCVIVAGFALAAYAIAHIFYGTAIAAAVLMLLMVTMAGYGTNALVQKTLANIVGNSF